MECFGLLKFANRNTVNLKISYLDSINLMEFLPPKRIVKSLSNGESANAVLKEKELRLRCHG